MKQKFTDEEEKSLAAALAEGLAIQHKFRPEPIYKLTGKGYMKSDGVTEIARIKEVLACAQKGHGTSENDASEATG